MKIKKGDLFKKLSEGVNISELVDKDLSIIGTNDEVDSISQIKSNSTTDSHADAVASKDTAKMPGMDGLNLMHTLMEDDVNDIVSKVDTQIQNEYGTTEVMSSQELKSQVPVVGRNLEILMDSIERRKMVIKPEHKAAIINHILTAMDISDIPDNLKETLRKSI